MRLLERLGEVDGGDRVRLRSVVVPERELDGGAPRARRERAAGGDHGHDHQGDGHLFMHHRVSLPLVSPAGQSSRNVEDAAAWLTAFHFDERPGPRLGHAQKSIILDEKGVLRLAAAGQARVPGNGLPGLDRLCEPAALAPGRRDVETLAQGDDDGHQEPLPPSAPREWMSKAFDAIVAAHDQAHRQGAYPLQLLGYAGLHVAVLLAGSPGGNGVLDGARRVPTQPGEALTLRGKETEAQRGEIVVTVDTKPSVPVRAELFPRGVRDLLDRTNEGVGVEPRNSLDGEADLG